MNQIQTAATVSDVQIRANEPERIVSGHGEEVSLRQFLLFLGRSRWIVLIGALTCGVAAAVASWVVTPEYTASTELMAVSNRTGSLGLGNLGGSAAQLSGLASLVGVNLHGGSSTKTLALATLQSEILTDTYIKAHNLLPILYAKYWDAKKNEWKLGDSERIPTLWKANRLFKRKIRSIDNDLKTGVITLSIRWKNPYQAAQWANGLVKLTNDYLRQKAINEAQRRIAFLNREAQRTNVVEIKNAIYSLMESEIKSEMVAKGRAQYALQIVDPAVPPQEKSFPKPILWIVGGVLAGIFFALLAGVLRETLADEQSGLSRTQQTIRVAAHTADA